EIIELAEERLHNIAPAVCYEHAERREVPRGQRDNHRADGELPGDRRRVQRSATAIRDECEVAWIQPLLKSHVTHGVRHGRRGDLEHAGGGTLEIHAER